MNTAEQLEADGEANSFEAVSQAGSDLIDVLSAQREGIERAPGLLVTNEDVRSIHEYVNTGLKLQLDLEVIKQAMGSKDVKIAGLDPESIQALYQKIHDHAATWSPLEELMREVGADLSVFSESLIITIGHILTLLNGMGSLSGLKPGDMTQEQLNALPPIELPDGDRKQLPDLVALVKEIEILVKKHSASTNKVASDISTFKTALENQVIPAVGGMLKLAAPSTTSETNQAMVGYRLQVATLNTRIEEIIKQYESYATSRWLGLLGGTVGAVLSFTIYGLSASALLKEKDTLIKEKQRIERTLLRIGSFEKQLSDFHGSMQSLSAQMTGALRCAKDIQSLWTLLAKLVKSSGEKFEGLDDGKLLVIFVSRLDIVVNNWKNIGAHSNNLLTAFNAATQDSRR